MEAPCLLELISELEHPERKQINEYILVIQHQSKFMPSYIQNLKSSVHSSSLGPSPCATDLSIQQLSVYLLRYLKGISNCIEFKTELLIPTTPFPTCSFIVFFLGKGNFIILFAQATDSEVMLDSHLSHSTYNPSVHPAGTTFEIYPESKGILYFPNTTPELLPKPPNWFPGLHHCSLIAHSSHSSQNEAFKSKSYHLFWLKSIIGTFSSA